MAADVASIDWYNEDSASPLTVTKPAAFGSGQILVVVHTAHGGALSDLTAPAGWVSQGTLSIGGSPASLNGKVWSWTFTGSEPATWDFPYFSSADSCLGLFRITGADTTPTVVVASTTFASSASSMDSPTVTPTGSNDLLIALLANTCGGTVLAETDPSGMTDRSQTQIAGNFNALAAASEQLASSSATGVRTWTSVTPTGQQSATLSIAIASAAGAPAGSPAPPPAVLPAPLLLMLAAENQAMWLGNPPAGTTFTQALDGTLTSAGALTKAVAKPLAGTVTPAGAMAKAVTKPGLAGSANSSGALTRQTQKALAGTLTSSGALSTIKVVLRSFAGTLTSSGALAKLAGKALTGSAASSGALTRQAQKALTGTAASSGALAKQDRKALAGASTPTGALSTIKVVIRAFAGTLTSAGALTRQVGKAAAGTVTPSGALAKAAARAFAGAVSPVGALAKLIRRAFAGSTSPTGAVSATTVGATQNATSTATVTAQRTSTATVTALHTSTPAVTGTASSTPTVSDG